VREQLPWYVLATGIAAHFIRAYLPDKGRVIDVGASTGNIGRAIARTLQQRKATLIPIDAAPAMSKVYDAPGELRVIDACDFPFESTNPDVIVCFLSLMFVPVAARADLIVTMRESLKPGGVLIVFDKIQPRGGYLGTVAYRLTLAAKHEAGASPANIIAKELSLSGVQRPLNEAELAGFVEVFRFGDFAGFVYESRLSSASRARVRASAQSARAIASASRPFSVRTVFVGRKHCCG